MALFGNDHKEDIEYLNVEIKKVWERLVAMENAIKERPSDFEKEAMQASRKTSEFKNKAYKRLEQANEILNQLDKIQNEISEKSISIAKTKDEVENHLQSSINSSDLIKERSEELLKSTNKISEIIEEQPNLKDEVEELDETIKLLEENASKANITYKGILTKKSEIDELHREILGYEDKDENGELVLIEGLKDELENSYHHLIEKSDQLKNQINEIRSETKNKFAYFIDESKKDLEKTKKDSKTEYDSINKRIEALLPNAMTAGLSSAFINKKSEEEQLFIEYKSKFSRGILFLSLVSFLPIAISIYFLATGVPLAEVINRTPKVILSFMPLYIPLIWTTISANKKMNLSKRLIEEYSHKQVLSMTIEGLSTQIDNIEDNTISEELRTKLLHNFLVVTSENPGNLISNYQKSDNPLLNLFDREKSLKDNNKDEMSIVNTVENRTKKIIEKAADEVEEGINNNKPD